MKINPAIPFIAMLFVFCPVVTQAQIPSLKEVFQSDFPVGVAINQRQFTGVDTNGVNLITSQFNAISPENVLKWEVVQPRPGANGFNFGPGDAYVAFGEKYNMLIVGHTLVWHSQTPRWVFRDENGRTH